MDLAPLELHEIASRVDLGNIRKLGYHLGFHHGQIQRFELANSQNPSHCTGTEDMLMMWHSNGGTRALLCETLRRVEQTALAIRVESGEFRTEPVGVPLLGQTVKKEPEAALFPNDLNSQSNNIPGAGSVAPSVSDMEQILPDLALDLTQEQFERLGLALNFSSAEMNRFSSTNYLTGRLTTTGTRDMLFEWKSRTEEGNRKQILRAALLSLQLKALANKYLS